MDLTGPHLHRYLIQLNGSSHAPHRVSCPQGVIARYLHFHSSAGGLGRIGCLVALPSPAGPVAQPAAESLQAQSITNKILHSSQPVCRI